MKRSRIERDGGLGGVGALRSFSHDLNRRKRRGSRVMVTTERIRPDDNDDNDDNDDEDDDPPENGVDMENPWRPHATLAKGAVRSVEVHFDGLEDALVHKIEEWGPGHVVVGCVAWLSNDRIIGALARCRRVLLIVNDEAYGRWGGGKCLEKYARLPGPAGDEATPAALFGHFPNVLAHLDRPGYEAVRAVGANTRSLMHAKYLVFFREYAQGELPAAVWTGSMNHTRQASRNVENALFLDSPQAALHYFHDFANTFFETQSLRV